MTDSGDSFVIFPETNEAVPFVSLLTMENCPWAGLKTNFFKSRREFGPRLILELSLKMIPTEAFAPVLTVSFGYTGVPSSAFTMFPDRSMRTSPIFFLRLPEESSAAVTTVARRTTIRSIRERILLIETSIAHIQHLDMGLRSQLLQIRLYHYEHLLVWLFYFPPSIIFFMLNILFSAYSTFFRFYRDTWNMSMTLRHKQLR